MPKSYTYPKLRSAMIEQQVDLSYLARRLLVKPQSLTNRFSGRTPWKLAECYQILNLLGIPGDRLPEFFPADMAAPVRQAKGVKKHG